MEKLTFQDILDASINNLQSGFSATYVDIIVSLMLTVMCVWLIVFTYRATFRGVLYQKSYAIALGMASMVTTLVIIAVSGNLVLSLGMVGALSIVRFRTAVKDPLDVVYMFWAIAVGIANGVAFFKISIIGSIFISIVLFIANSYKSSSMSYLLITHQESGSLNRVIEILKPRVKKYRIRSRISNKSIDEATIEIKIRESEIDDLMKELKDDKNTLDVSLIEYSQELSAT